MTPFSPKLDSCSYVSLCEQLVSKATKGVAKHPALGSGFALTQGQWGNFMTKQRFLGATALSTASGHPVLRCVGVTCKCNWPPKWVLMIMTRTIKELMRLLSYEQDLKSLKLKRASIDTKFA